MKELKGLLFPNVSRPILVAEWELIMLTELPRLRFYYFFVAVILISSRIFAATQVYDVSQVQVIRGEGLSTMEFGVSSPDGKHFYASLFGLSGIAVFDHTQSALTLKHVYRSGSEGISNLQSPGEMVFNAAGTILYIGAENVDGFVTSFARDPATGLLSLIDNDTQPGVVSTPHGTFLRW